MNIPFAINRVNGRLLVLWLESNNLDMRFGFFRDSINQLPKREGVSQITPLDTLKERNNTRGVENPGLIFHCSRCGSTLLCQMLKQHEHCIVIGEPGIISQILNEDTLSNLEKQTLLAAIFNIYATWADRKGKPVIIKTTSWHIKHFKLLNELAYDSPKIFLYREPTAVINSLARNPPSWLYKTHKQQSKDSSTQDIAAQAYLQNTSRMITHRYNENIALLDFNDLGHKIENILGHFRLPLYKALIDSMKQQAKYNAKSHAKNTLFEPFVKHGDIQIEANEPLRARLVSNYSTLNSSPNNLGHTLSAPGINMYSRKINY